MFKHEKLDIDIMAKDFPLISMPTGQSIKTSLPPRML
jgi:hypothetical protein